MTRLTPIALITTSILAIASQFNMAQASQAPWYEVEVFIFEHPSNSKELWSDEVKLVRTEDAVDFITPAITTDISTVDLGLSSSDTPQIDCSTPNWEIPDASSYNIADDDNPESDSSDANTNSRAFITDENGQLIQIDTSNIEAPSYDESNPLSGSNQPETLNHSPTPECIEQFSQNRQTRLNQVPVSIAANIEKQAIWGTQNQLLAESQSQFSDIIKKLNREPGAKPLLHMTWQQVMLPRHRAKPVRLFAGHDLSAQFNLDGTKVDTSQLDLLSQFGFLQDYFTAKEDMPVWQLDGLFNIYLNHYLYVETQLNYREAGVKAAAIENDQQDTDAELEMTALGDTVSQVSESSTPFLYAIPMIQNRRVRSSEIHYLDHPKLGIVFQIRKMPQPQEIEPIIEPEGNEQYLSNGKDLED